MRDSVKCIRARCCCGGFGGGLGGGSGGGDVGGGVGGSSLL